MMTCLTALSEEELELLVALDDEGVESLQVWGLVGEPLLAGGELEDLGDVGEVAPLVAVQVVVRLLLHHVEPDKKLKKQLHITGSRSREAVPLR
ncbi:MAG: hypothetical protein ACK56I_02110, partial [bacterium]